MLEQLPVSMKQALLAAMEVAMKCPQYDGGSESPAVTPQRADQLIRLSLYMDRPGLPHLQALLFMALEATNRGALVMQGHNGPRPGNYIALAVEEANGLDITNPKVFTRSLDGNALQSARSIALSICVLDVLNGLAEKRDGNIKIGVLNNGFITMQGDEERVGHRLYWLARKYPT